MVSQGPALGKSAQELLGEFVQTGRQEPFEEIVRRYAGMVFNVCFQILRDTHDAEDATQAVFLTLAVKSKTEVGIKYIAPWLQKVAQRLALDVKRSKTRRKVREERHSFMQRYNETDQDASKQVDLDEVKVVLRDELDKLPAKYRLPLILHYFGGLKPEEMAKELGCKPSTLGVRLHRGRKLLADSLAGRGIVVSGSVLGIALATLVQCSVTDHLIRQTSHAAMQMISGNTVGAGMSAQVMGYNRLATHGLYMMRLKSLVTAAVLIASAAAGAAEFVGKVNQLGLHLDLSGQIRSIFGSVVKSLTSPLRVSTNSSTAQPTVAAVAKTTSDAVATNVEVKDSNPTVESSAPVASVEVSKPIAVKAADSTTPASTSENLVASASTIPAFTIPHPTVRWPAPTPSNTPVELATPTLSTQSDATPQPTAATFASGQSISVGGGFGTNQKVTWSNPAPLSVPKITVGGDGIGDLAITGNAVVNADKITLGQDTGSTGTLDVSGNASVTSNKLTVGDKGAGTVNQKDSSIVDANTIVIGAEGVGTYNLYDGTLLDKTIIIGAQGSGTFNQVNGQHEELKLTPSDNGGLSVAQAPGSSGVYELRAGRLQTKSEIIGQNGSATVKQTGGSNVVSQATIGEAEGGNGTYKLPGGNFQFVRSADSSSDHPALVIGNQGAGALLLGGTTGTGRISETGAGKPVSMAIRQGSLGTGRLQGYGTVNLHGTLDENGQVIADGYGQEEDLNLSSFAGITNTIDNAPGESNGWFARHGGKLELPAMNVTAPVSVNPWGEDPSDTQLDLINSVRFRFSGVTNPGAYHVDLLAPDRPDVPDRAVRRAVRQRLADRHRQQRRRTASP